MNRVLRDTGAKYPIVQAPMGWIARSQLASAVSNAGGLGVIETSSGEVDVCKEEIKKMTSLTDKPFGINLPLLFLKDSSMVDFCVDNNVNFVTTSAGDPSKYIKVLKDADITVYHAVPNLQGALKAFEAGVDGLVVEGTEGGGFKGYEEIGLAVLIQAIKKEINLPIIAAGGIVDGIVDGIVGRTIGWISAKQHHLDIRWVITWKHGRNNSRLLAWPHTWHFTKHLII